MKDLKNPFNRKGHKVQQRAQSLFFENKNFASLGFKPLRP
jgi:hypothetical protein